MGAYNFPTADFTPQLAGYTGQGAFRFWCQKVLPIVYDDSLSYYELLNKMVIYLNNVIKDVATVEDNVGLLLNAYNLLQNYVNTYFENLDVQEEINNKLDEMAESGVLGDIIYTRVKPEIDKISVWCDVSGFVDELTSETIETAITSALRVSHNLYIPDGEYICNLSFRSGVGHVNLLLSDECVLRTENSTPAIKFSGCSFTLQGGKVAAGYNYLDRTYVYDDTETRGDSHGIIEVEDCNSGSIKFVTCNNSNYGSVIQIKNSNNITVENCYFAHLVNSGIHILFHCENIVVRKCSFKYIRYHRESWYSYAVYTGAMVLDHPSHDPDFVNDFVPPDGLTYDSNYVYDSDDSGLDTHGARNVIITNNCVINTIAAITAYNDINRVSRPSDWIMSGVYIANNFCSSNKKKNPKFTHGFIMLGNALSTVDDETVDEEFSHSCYAYSNCILENNYLKSSNDNGYLIRMGLASSHVIVRNNIIDSSDSGSAPIKLWRCLFFEFSNNSVLNYNRATLVVASIGKAFNNRNINLWPSSYGFTYIEGLDGGSFRNRYPQCVKFGERFYSQESNNRVGLKSASFGLRAIEGNALGYYTEMRCRCVDGSCWFYEVVDGNEVAKAHRYIPGLSITATNVSTGTSSNYYIKDIETFSRCDVVNLNNAKMPNGEYIIRPRYAQMADDECWFSGTTKVANALIKSGRRGGTQTLATLPTIGTDIYVDLASYSGSYYKVKANVSIEVASVVEGVPTNKTIWVTVQGYMISTSVSV